MREAKLNLEILADQKAILVVQCPECGDRSRFLLDEVFPGTSVLCNCGGVLHFTDDSLQAILQKLDAIKKTQD